MGGKWKPYIIYELTSGLKRPSQLQRSVPEASTRVLNQQLKELGCSLIPLIEHIRDGGLSYRPTLESILEDRQ